VGNLGKPYGFEFDSNNNSRIVCPELVYRSSYHGSGSLAFPLTKRLGRFTLTGDDIIAQSLDGPAASRGAQCGCLEPIVLILKRRDARAHLAPPDRILPRLRRIGRGWRPARRLNADEETAKTEF
jgi:hypothetical protein